MDNTIRHSFISRLGLFLRIALLIAFVVTPLSYSKAEETGVVFQKTYLKDRGSVSQKDTFSISDLDDEYYLSVETRKGSCSSAEIKLNGQKITALKNLKLRKKHLVQLPSLQLTNEISVNAVGRIGSETEVKIVRLGAFDAILGPQEIIPSRSSQSYQFSTHEQDSEHILVVDFSDSKSLGLGNIRLNGKKIANSSDFILSKKKKFLKLIDVQEQNTLNIKLTGPTKAHATISVLEPTVGDVKRGIVPIAGGEIYLKNVATVNFDASNFVTPAPITLSKTNDPDTKADFDISSLIYNVDGRNDYEVRINTGLEKPKGLTTVTLNIPDEFLNSFTSEDQPQVFAQIYQESEMDILDNFEIVDSVFDESSKTITVQIDSSAHTNTRSLDDSYEAILLVAKSPTKQLLSSLQTQSLMTVAAKTCQGDRLGSPLDSLTVTGIFNPPVHMGTDFRAAIGTPVKAMADGKVLYIGYQIKKAKNPRVDSSYRGWGRFVLIEHPNKTRTLYAHLTDDSVKVTAGTTVTKGTVIALSGNTGIGTGPHLHVEYGLGGVVFNSSKKIDPEPCILNDNGPMTITISNEKPSNDPDLFANNTGTKFDLWIEPAILYPTIIYPIGGTGYHEKKTFELPSLPPGKYRLWVRGEFDDCAIFYNEACVMVYWVARVEVTGKVNILNNNSTVYYFAWYNYSETWVTLEILP